MEMARPRCVLGVRKILFYTQLSSVLGPRWGKSQETQSSQGTLLFQSQNDNKFCFKHKKETMEFGTTVAEVHKCPPARVHTSARRNRSHSRHKCHKHKQRAEEDLQSQVSQLKNENYLLNRRLNVSMSSIDSGLVDGLPPFEVDLKKAYQHVKIENNQLMEDIQSCRIDSEKLKKFAEGLVKDNNGLKEDIAMLQNLVYRLNVELEKFQNLRDKLSPGKNNFELPKYYQKNFVKPFVPLLKAYTETIAEKNEMIELLEKNFERFGVSFNEVLRENETLYKELENRASNGDCGVIDEIKGLRDELNVVRGERDLFQTQFKELEKVTESRGRFILFIVFFIIFFKNSVSIGTGSRTSFGDFARNQRGIKQTEREMLGV